LVSGKTRLFLWIGEHSNIIERAKAHEIYEWIRLKKDLGIHKVQTQFHIIDNKTSDDSVTTTPQLTTKNENEFFSLLDSNKFGVEKLNAQINAQSADEDEKYETMINETNMVYKVEVKKSGQEQEMSSASSSNDENSDDCDDNDLAKYVLEPIERYCGNPLSYNMLDEDSVFVFDFGSEVYVWSGRNAYNKTKKAGLLLGKKLYDSGYDYSGFSLSPLKHQLNLSIKPLSDNEEATMRGSTYFKSCKSRPRWTVFGRQVQNVETVLFREKFIGIKKNNSF
jgi:supervillin